MTDTSLARDSNNSRRWSAWIPADNVGRYWTRYDMAVPTDVNLTYIAMQKVLYGRVREGAIFDRDDLTTNGTWADADGNGWFYVQSNTSADYAEAIIPPDHNVLQVCFYNINGNGGTVSFAWNDAEADTFDLTAYDTGDNVNEPSWVTVATNSTKADGARALRVTLTNNTRVRVVSIRSFIGDSVGDPANAGHDFITDLDVGNNGTKVGGFHKESAADDEVWVLGNNGSASEFGLLWAADGGVKKITGGITHFTAGNAPYTYHAGEYATGPDIFVDGVAADEIWDDANNPRGTILTGGNITIKSTGFADWDESGTEDANEPDLTWVYCLTAQSLDVTISIIINAATDIHATTKYAGMLRIPPANANGYMTQLPSLTRNDLTVDRNLAGNSCELYLDGIPAVISLSVSGPAAAIWWLEANKKMHIRADIPGDFGGTDPAAGDVLTFGGHYEIRNPDGPAVSTHADTQGSAITGAF